MFAFAASTPLPKAGLQTTRICLTPTIQSSPQLKQITRVRTPRMVLFDSETIPIKITGNNIQITESLRNYINDKLSKISRRFGHLIGKLDVHLTVEQNPSVPNRHKAEVVAFAGKTILRTEVRADDMYAAIDTVEQRISRTIRKYKERKELKSSKIREAADASGVVADVGEVEDSDQEDDYADVYQNQVPEPVIPPVNGVVKRKVFPMPLQTVEEAVLCCEYVDHPWYLFRNAATNEISLVYKRNHGGYGLIEPSNPDVVDDTPI